jgi:hypothetical protein
MNRMFAPALGALLIALAACSSGPSIVGGVQKVDNTAHTVTLYNTTVYTFDANTDLSKFKVGDPVRITYTLDPTTRKNMATSISAYG